MRRSLSAAVRRGFGAGGTGYVDPVSNEPERHDVPTGPVNPRGPAGPDAPAPPGGPLRTDAPAGSTTPGGPADPPQEPEPEVHPSSTPDGPQTIPTPPSAPQPVPERSAAGGQQENAGSSLDQPSVAAASDAGSEVR
jgi:hypothetical protein